MSTPTPNKNISNALAIDPGYDRVGIAIFNKQNLLHSECFIPNEKDFSKRLAAIAARLRVVIAEYKPQTAAMETLFFSKNVKTAIKVAEARGAITLVLSEAHVSLFEYSPQAVKMAVTGSGNADKKGVIKMITLTMRLPAQKRLDDEYDAIALGIAHQTTAIHKGF